MLIRIFPEGFAFIQNQDLEVQNIGNGLYSLPILRQQIDLDTLQSENDILITENNTAIVYKDGNRFEGVLVDQDGMSVTLTDNGIRTTIREYDRIHVPEFITIQSANNMILDEVTVSYVTTGIRGNIVHRLDIDTGVLQTLLHIENDTAIDIDNATIEIVTSEQARPQLFRQEQALAASNAASTFEPTPGGTIIRLEDMHDIPAGYEAFLPIYTQTIDGEIIYMISAPNGTTNATYTLQWRSQVDLPPGQFFVYRNGTLEARTNIGLVGANQEQTITLLNIPSVYARGTITRTTAVQQVSDQLPQPREVSIQTVQIQGTIFNTLPEEITVHLRYFVGDSAVNVLSEDMDAFVEDGYVVFPHMLAADDSDSYDHTFTVTR